MNISKKQISLGALATVAVIATPIATVVSCGEDTPKETINVINLEDVKSPKELFSHLNKILNNFMPEKGIVIGDNGADPKGSFEKISNYMNNIKTNTDTITFKYKGEKVVWDLTKLIKTIEAVKSSIAMGYANHSTIDFGALVADKNNPTMSIYITMQSTAGALQGQLIGMKLLGFAALPKDGYDSYKRMLEDYHDLSMELIGTKLFKEWIKGKEYVLPVGDLLTTPQLETVKPGEKYDVKGLMPPIASPKFGTESNNFEAQWVLSILNMY